MNSKEKKTWINEKKKKKKTKKFSHLAQSFVQLGLQPGDKVAIGGPTKSKVRKRF